MDIASSVEDGEARGLGLSLAQRQDLEHHAQATYPEECCGLLLGTLATGHTPRTVHQIQPLKNQWVAAVAAVTDPDGAKPHNSRHRRYWIDPKDLLAAQRDARDRNCVILGIYHSHPDHPAVPSECDRALAWPEYSYVILSVHQGQVVDCQSWQLDEHHQFQPEPIQTKDAPALPKA